MSRSNYKYKVYNGKIIKDILKNSRIYFMALFFIFGLVAGAVFVKYNDDVIGTKVSEIASAYIKSKTGQGMLQAFLSPASINMMLFAINIFLAFSLIGYPIIVWLPFLRGLGIGVFSGYMYSCYKLIGLGYCAVLIYPSAVISSFVFILACCDSCDYSKNAYEKSIRAKGQFEKDETKIYLFRQFIYISISLCSSLIEAVFTVVFSRFFEV